MIKEEIHRESTLAYLELESRASQLEKKLRKAVNKARYIRHVCIVILLPHYKTSLTL